MPVHSASRSETTSSAPGRHCRRVLDKWGGSRQSVSNSRRTFKCNFFEILLKIYIVYCTQSILGEFLPQVLSLDIFSPRPPPLPGPLFSEITPQEERQFSLYIYCILHWIRGWVLYLTTRPQLGQDRISMFKTFLLNR